MLTINSNEKKKLKFGISVAGVMARDLKGALRLTVEGVEYGFPVQIVEGNVEVEIPPLKNLINEIDSLKRYDVKLELIANDTYIVPWTDVANIKTPVSVKVSESVIEEDEIVEKIKIGVTNVDEEVIEEPKPKLKPKKKIVVEKKKTRINKRKIKSKFRKMLEE
jgi:hypothetical protein